MVGNMEDTVNTLTINPLLSGFCNTRCTVVETLMVLKVGNMTQIPLQGHNVIISIY